MQKWNQFHTKLNNTLAEYFPNLAAGRVQHLLQSIEFPIDRINFSQAAVDGWYEVVNEARKLQLEIDLIRAVREEYGDEQQLRDIENGLSLSTQPTGTPTVTDDIYAPDATAIESLEKIIGSQSTLLPISFLEIGLMRSRCVARIKLANGGLGTGFLIDKNLLLTNNHVLRNLEDARGATAQFNYQRNAKGLDVSPVEFSFDPDGKNGFLTSVEDDWTAVKVTGDLSEWGLINLFNAADVGITDRVNIIQHPGGGPKQIALYHNVVAYSGEKLIQYLTDTMPGSSGSPVFNSQWDIVAIHHAGGNLFDPSKKQFFYRNEGIKIKPIIAVLSNKNMIH